MINDGNRDVDIISGLKVAAIITDPPVNITVPPGATAMFRYGLYYSSSRRYYNVQVRLILQFLLALLQCSGTVNITVPPGATAMFRYG